MKRTNTVANVRIIALLNEAKSNHKVKQNLSISGQIKKESLCV